MTDEEMAEEWRNSLNYEIDNDTFNNIVIPCIEFGYNKANEWHKADVPTSPINKVVLGYIKHYNSKLFCLVGWNGEWWYDASTYNDEVKLIAWKEIVLPELKANGI